MSETPSHPPPLDYVSAPPESSDFNHAFQEVIGLEGGYVNDPDDYGGETNWGISKRAYPEVNIQDLTLEQAASLYLRDYWNRMRLGEVESYEIARELFEQGVNLGTTQAITHLQQSLCLIGEGVEIDGVIGPETLQALNSLTPEQQASLLKCLNGYQFHHYMELVETNPSQKKFLVGWLKRIA